VNNNDRVALQFAVTFAIDHLKEKLLPLMQVNGEDLFPQMDRLLDQLEAIRPRLDAVQPSRENVGVSGTDMAVKNRLKTLCPK
jgi:hypothetical protein